jgi:hypothetical protein
MKTNVFVGFPFAQPNLQKNGEGIDTEQDNP